MIKVPRGVEIFDTIYTDFKIGSPSPRVLSSLIDFYKAGDHYSAFKAFIFGSTVAAFDIDGKEETDREKLDSIIKWIPYKSAEFLAVQGLVKHNKMDDHFEANYPCPTIDCKGGYKSVLIEEDGLDTRERISELTVVMDDNHEQTFVYNFDDSNNPLPELPEIGAISSIEMRYPALQHCINALNRLGGGNEIEMQNGIYYEAITKINGEEITEQQRKRYVKALFMDKVTYADSEALAAKVSSYGIDPYTEKRCKVCGKRWSAVVPTENFFVSALKPSPKMGKSH